MKKKNNELNEKVSKEVNEDDNKEVSKEVNKKENKKVNKEIKSIFVMTSLLLIVLILSYSLIRTNSKINYIKKRYNYVNTLKEDIAYMNLEYDKLLQLDNENKELVKNNTTLENNIKNLEKDILNLQEKIVKLGNTK